MKKIFKYSILIMMAVPLMAVSDKAIITDKTLTSNELSSLSLSDLMNIDVNVASGQKPLALRESPGIVTVITREEILNTGANDLIEVLKLIPGIEFGVDVLGVVGITVRGNWAHEGKVLLMMDGIELNHLNLGTTAFGNHYPVDNIKLIEIIRGPGSAIYGGNAELAVINIITQKGRDIDGITISGRVGKMSENKIIRKEVESHTNLNFSVGTITDKLEFSAYAKKGSAKRSDKAYVSSEGDSYDMEKNSELITEFATVEAEYMGLKTNLIIDNYSILQRDGLFRSHHNPYLTFFKTTASKSEYNLALLEGDLILTPSIKYTRSQAWMQLQPPRLPDTVDGTYEPLADESFYKYSGGVTASFDLLRNTNIIDNLNLSGGSEYVVDKGVRNTRHPDDYWDNNKSEITYYNVSTFIQGILQTAYGNLTLGIRSDGHEVYDDAYGPRAAYTIAFDKLHGKLLYSSAYNTPNMKTVVMNARRTNAKFNNGANPSIIPERAHVYEAEMGYLITPSVSVITNVYYMQIKDPIIFIADQFGPGYENFSETGTKGLEIEFKNKGTWGYGTLNYSFYSAEEINTVADYKVPNKSGPLLGTAQHKIVFNSNFKISKNFSINPSLEYLGTRYGYNKLDISFGPEGPSFNTSLKEYQPITLINVSFNIHDLYLKGADIRLGIYNLTNEDYIYIQPYNGWHAPLPGSSQEYRVNLSYHF